MFDGVEGDTEVEAEVDGKRRKGVVQNLETAPTGGEIGTTDEDPRLGQNIW